MASPPSIASSLSPNRLVRVAAVQCPAMFGDIEANRTRLTQLVRQATAEGAKIVVLPEAAITGYVSQDLEWNWHLPGRPLGQNFRGRDLAPYAETVPGPSVDHFAALAKELQIYLTAPLIESTGGNAPRYFNTVCLLNPQGEIAAHYRKLNPWPPTEQSWGTAGDRGLQTCDTEYGRVGLAICFDIHTILEQYAERRLWALLFSSCWVDEEHPALWFWHTLPAMVRTQRHYLIGANWSVDQPQAWRGYGFSTIVSPEGRVLATAKSLLGSEIVYADLEAATAGNDPRIA